MEKVGRIAASTTKGTTRRVFSLLAEAGAGKVLDAPAGRGALSSLLKGAGFDVTAVDLDGGSFAVDGVEFVLGDLNQPLPFPDGSFDFVTCVDGIEHLENPYALIREFHRVLVPGGQLILSTPNISALRSRQRYLFTGFHNKGRKPMEEEHPSPRHHISLMTFPELRYGMHRVGLYIDTVTANRIKISSLYTLLYYPLVAVWTRRVIAREKDPRQRELMNREIYRQLLSWPVCMGETLIIRARKAR